MSQIPKAFAFLIVVCMAFSAIAVMSDVSDATAIGSIDDDGFKENQSGTLTVKVANTEGTDIDVTITVLDEDGDEIKSATSTVADGTHDVEISFKLGAGSHDLTVKATAVLTGTTETVTVSPGTATYTIDVDKSIWSGWVPYVVLAIVAIIVILVIVLWYRGRPKSKPAVTFTDLEEGKTVPQEAAPASDTGRKKYEAPKPAKQEEQPSTGRIKYKSDRRK